MVYKAQLAKKRGQGESSTPGFVAVKILKGSWLIELVDQCNTSLSATFSPSGLTAAHVRHAKCD